MPFLISWDLISKSLAIVNDNWKGVKGYICTHFIHIYKTRPNAFSRVLLGFYLNPAGVIVRTPAPIPPGIEEPKQKVIV